MPFGKDDAYFVASLLAGQLPIGKGAAWLVKRAWRAALHQNAQRDPGAQGDEQAIVRSALERLEQNDAKLNDKVSAILECLREFQSSGASQPGPSADAQSSGHATTTTTTTQPGEASSSTGGYQTAHEQASDQGETSSSQPDLSNMRTQDLILLLLREVRKLRKELKRTLPH